VTALDLVCFGRICVDLYSEQLGAGLGGSESFAKYVGGSAANICVGAARLGLRTAMLTRVGDEAFGHFLIDALQREGIATGLVQLDGERPTSLVALAVREVDDFPRIFFYADAPDLALDPAAVDVRHIAGAAAVLIGGSVLSRPALADFALELAGSVRASGAKVLLDVDYRPVLWGATPIARGNDVSSASPAVADAHLPLLPLCDLVVGTREEICVATGCNSVDEALERLRSVSAATIVVKSGASGATAHPGAAPSGEPLAAHGVTADPFAVDVVNTVGAGDAFMSGFLSGWLRGRALADCVSRGNASGAVVVTRHGCTPAMPYRLELDRFIERGGVARPDDDEELERLHRVAARRPTPEQLFVLAIDHRWQLEALADSCGVGRQRIVPLKQLFAQGFLEVAARRDDCGLLVDAQYGAAVLESMTGGRFFLARSIDVAGSRPVELLAGDEVHAALHSWPADQVVKVMCYAHPEDGAELMARQTGVLLRLGRACRAAGRELLVELQAPAGESFTGGQLPELVAQLYGAGLRPDWWKLPAVPDEEVWKRMDELLGAQDPSCRGILVLGSTATREQLAASFRAMRPSRQVRGFAVGRAIFSGPAGAWMRGEIDDAALVAAVAAAYAETIAAWMESAPRRAAPGAERAGITTTQPRSTTAMPPARPQRPA
jgi:5-dehydro-2-deoxygluconokinase